MYEDLIRFFFRVLYQERIEGKATSEKEMLKFFSDFVQRLTVWGSDGVVRAFVDYRRQAVVGSKPANPVGVMLGYEKLLFEIRLGLRASKPRACARAISWLCLSTTLMNFFGRKSSRDFCCEIRFSEIQYSYILYAYNRHHRPQRRCGQNYDLRQPDGGGWWRWVAVWCACPLG